MESVQEEFAGIGREIQPGVLCEMLEIKDEEWRNAVEGYLNTQRFYVLVEPENFDIALGIYDRLRREKKVYGVGLINTKDLEKYDTAPAGTLAEVVTSQNKYARQYSNMLLTSTGFLTALVIILTFTAGSTLVMWLGDQISEHGIGNGRLEFLE